MPMKPFIFIAVIAVAWAIPLYEPFTGHFTYFTISGTSACGQGIDASQEELVAVGKDWFTSLNPNTDPICDLCLKIHYKHKIITIPVVEKCAHCSKHHMELSLPAFRKLVDHEDVRTTDGANFTFVNC
uniref:Barwin domain-containing protein n=1 Tax=Panagrellus redivivus TaxID=6233 RepID=A0A7E4V621_PANRE